MKPKPDLAQAARQVREIYDEWQARPSERHCPALADCCRFKLTGRTPYLTRGEAWVAARAWRAAGRKELALPADGSCPMLHPHTGRCGIYAGRPFGCRTHFCAAAGGSPARHEVRALIQRLEDIDTRLGGSGAINLPTAVSAALGWRASG
jgi:Fe-S-cluster containining protein